MFRNNLLIIIVDGSLEMSDVEREAEGRKGVKELRVIGIAMMFDRWIRYEWAKWSGVENEKKRN